MFGGEKWRLDQFKIHVFVNVLHWAVKVDAGKFDFGISTFKIEQFPAVLWGAAEYVDAVGAWVNQYVFLQAGQLAVTCPSLAPAIA